MPDKILTRDEIERNRVALRHLPAWLTFRDLTQAQLAERMSVSEATVSKWLRGHQRMSVGQLVTIAHILETPWEAMFEAPGVDGAGSRYKELAEAAQGLTEDDLRNLSAVARSMARRPK
jgi:transcriptional regulator with XRE-family HTH domain